MIAPAMPYSVGQPVGVAEEIPRTQADDASGKPQDHQQRAPCGTFYRTPEKIHPRSVPSWGTTGK